MLLLLFILGGVLAYIRNSKKGSSEIKQSPLERRLTGDEGNDPVRAASTASNAFLCLLAIPVLSTREDLSAEPV